MKVAPTKGYMTFHPTLRELGPQTSKALLSIRRATYLNLPDSLVFATALALQADCFVTADGDFTEDPEVRKALAVVADGFRRGELKFLDQRQFGLEPRNSRSFVWDVVGRFRTGCAEIGVVTRSYQARTSSGLEHVFSYRHAVGNGHELKPGDKVRVLGRCLSLDLHVKTISFDEQNIPSLNDDASAQLIRRFDDRGSKERASWVSYADKGAHITVSVGLEGPGRDDEVALRWDRVYKLDS